MPLMSSASSSICSAAAIASVRRRGTRNGQLGRRLSPVAAIGDDDSVLSAHHEEARGTGEAGEVADVRVA